MKKTLQIANILALAATLFVNYLSNTGIFNGETMASVSNRYGNLFTPAGYAFLIWPVIYLLLILFVIHQSRGLFGRKEVRPIVEKVGWLFVLSCVANCAWIICWLYDFTGLSIAVMALLLISLLAIVQRTEMEMEFVRFKVVLYEWWPFATYLGWITVALIANVAAYLTKIGWDGFGLPPLLWTILMICIGAGVNILLIWKRNLRESAGAAAWGLVAVAVANKGGVQIIMLTAFLAAGVLLVVMGIHGFLNRGRHFYVNWPKRIDL